jgi:hypothetical protein
VRRGYSTSLRVRAIFLNSLVMTLFVLGLANSAGRANLPTSDALTGLPLIPATDSGAAAGNEPSTMPASPVCNSKMQAVFYRLYNINVDATVAWYSSHLAGFKKAQGYASQRSQTVFYNSDGTILVFVTGQSGAARENTNAFSVAYEKFQPGLNEKTISSVVQEKIVCQ